MTATTTFVRPKQDTSTTRLDEVCRVYLDARENLALAEKVHTDDPSVENTERLTEAHDTYDGAKRVVTAVIQAIPRHRHDYHFHRFFIDSTGTFHCCRRPTLKRAWQRVPAI